MSNISISEAVFLASLPLKRSIFAYGGWQCTAGPGSADWQSFLRDFFLPAELKKARKEASSYPSHLKLSLVSHLLPVTAICFWDSEYPSALAASYDPPAVLFVWGNRWTDYENYLAMVGTRAASSLCEPVALGFIKQKKHELASKKSTRAQQLCIVSGLAYGVDRVCHLAAISQQLPGIAVLGSGLQHASPKHNLDIIRKAFTQDLPFTLLSEFAPYQQARPAHFPRRNRIISALCSATVVLQAPIRSGALITARYALEEGREVLVFDHPVFDVKPGCNDGARKLLESGAERIIIPELEEKILSQPPASYHASPEQLLFWRASLKGLKWLGGRYYLQT